LESLKIWWNKYGNAVTIVAVIILIVVVGKQRFESFRERRTAQAMTDLDSASSPQAVEEIITANKSSVVTPLARLRLGSFYFNAEQYSLALSTYEEFLAKHPRHNFAPVAELGLAHSLEATGKVSEAADKFEKFLQKNPDSFLSIPARLGLGRTLILSGKKDEGKAVLDLLITEKAGSRWAVYADELARAKDRLKIPQIPSTTDLSSFFSPEMSPLQILEEPVDEEASVTDETSADDNTETVAVEQETEAGEQEITEKTESAEEIVTEEDEEVTSAAPEGAVDEES
jgi:predicted negative regulator of RcsB-dependent stress response